MSRNTDYIFDVADGWQAITKNIDEILGTSNFNDDHIEAINEAGYTVDNYQKVEMANFSIEFFKSSFNHKYPYLLQVSDSYDVNFILIANYISLQQCVAELVTNEKSLLELSSNMS
ncbi:MULTISPECIES: hypothetical protein [Pseudoalteromonas]|uniref:Uncharacterized protein n=1 Tax=Pseudoalteromonas amylolytica TaxID=1859457 RepID=A0A1S1MXR0_9GAMM|nr:MULTISPECIES: hypothetical protein [Pseudoalteromonas]OHU90828.1 hypothetical protein BFC16_04315 [Pseudoalteromonas sp. JW3]OHU92552.1 hypothetical protein BET10_03575 [Pseudoalteromonas amylolytica]